MLKRRIVLLAPALELLAVVVPPLLLADRLPDPLASHWSLDGTPDGTAVLAGTTVALAVGVLVAWALLAAQAARRDPALRLTAAIATGAAAYQLARGRPVRPRRTTG